MSGRVPDQRVRLVASRQRWEDVAFLHWRCDPRAVRALLPAGLDVDVVDGSAWLGVTPFRMRDARLPGVPREPGYGAPWPLFAAEPARLRTDLPERCGVAAGPPDLRVLWSPGVDVRLGVPRPA